MERKSRKPEETMNDEVLQEVSQEMGLPLSIIRDVVNNGQSKFTAYVMSNNEFNGVRWPYFGVFKAKHKNVQILSYMKGLDPLQKKFFKEQLRRERKANYKKVVEKALAKQENGKNKTD